MSAPDTPPAWDDPEDPAPSRGLAAYVVTHEDAPDECTIAPRGAMGFERLSRWMTAQEGSYVDLAEMR